MSPSLQESATLRDGTRIRISTSIPPWLEKRQADNVILLPAIQKAEESKRRRYGERPRPEEIINIAELQRLADAYDLSLHEMHKWAYRYLDANNQEYPGDGNLVRPSYEIISTNTSYFAKDDFLLRLYTYAAQRESLDLLLTTLNKSTIESKVKYRHDDLKRAGYYWKDGVKKAIYSCGYCGSDQEVELAERRTALVCPCQGCGAKLQFEPPAPPYYMRVRETYPPEVVEREIERMQRTDYGKAGRGKLLTDLNELTRMKAMDGDDANLWVARMYLALYRGTNRVVPKLPFEDIAGSGMNNRVRETLIVALKLMGDDENAVRDLCLDKIDPRNNRWMQESLGRNPNVEVCMCHACGDVFKVDTTNAELQMITVDGGMTIQGYKIPQVKCVCGSADVHHTADNNSVEQLADGASENQMVEYVTRHFGATELNLLGMYTFGTEFTATEHLPGDTIGRKASELLAYARRRDTLSSLGKKIKEFRHESGSAGITRNYSCSYCGTIHSRTVNSEGWIGGGCGQCGGHAFKTAPADANPQASQVLPFTHVQHAQILNRLAANMAGVGETERVQEVDGDLADRAVRELIEKRQHFVPVVMKIMLDRDRLITELRKSSYFKGVIENWESANLSELVMQIYMFAQKNHQLRELVATIRNVNSQAFDAALNAVDTIPSTPPTITRPDFTEVRQIVAYLNPALWRKITDGNEGYFYGPEWERAYKEVKEDSRFNSVANAILGSPLIIRRKS